ncbi:IclR family transcriptional regulator [Peterkaempfera bronchialis]|uniref:IclR family transcriptional regulator n=1 Tax=Peterkaempfera bronchialis TaxID=2126346 RepID=UPI003C2E732B
MTTTDEKATAARNNSASLRRALAILLHLGGDDAVRGATLSELASGLSMNKSTLLRLLAPLCEVRLVEQDADTGRYRLGWRTAQLGQTYLERLDLRDTAHDVLEQLTANTGETTYLVIADLPEVVYLDKVDSLQPVRMYSRIGSRQSAHCTGVGKALLAHADADAVNAVIAHGLPQRTPRTHTTEAALRADLAVIRRRGYAVDDIENEPDIRCVAAPVFDHAGAAACAVSVSGPAGRVTAERVPELGALVAAAAEEISRRLGARR